MAGIEAMVNFAALVAPAITDPPVPPAAVTTPVSVMEMVVTPAEGRTTVPKTMSEVLVMVVAETTVTLVKLKQLAQIDVGDTVAIGQHETFGTEPRLQALDAAAGRRVETGRYQVYLPIIERTTMVFDSAAAEVDRHSAIVQRVRREVTLDHIALVAQRHAELAKAVVGVDLHDVPEYRASADLDHRLRPSLGFLHKTRAETPCENDYFHVPVAI